MPSFPRRRLLAMIPVALLSAGCSAFTDPSVDAGIHEVFLHYRVSTPQTLQITITDETQQALLDQSFNLSPSQRVDYARFEGKPERIKITLDENDPVSHEWPSTLCDKDEVSGVIVNPVSKDTNVDGICEPIESVGTRSTGTETHH